MHLPATEQERARELHKQHGDTIQIVVGALPYPLRRSDTALTPPRATIVVDGLELQLVLDGVSVPSGSHATGRIIMRNVGSLPIELETGQPMVGMTLDSEAGQVVGVFVGFHQGVGRRVRLGPDQEDAVTAVVGTASCSVDIGYVLPPGPYLAAVPLKVLGDHRPEGRQFGVLVPPPAQLELT